LKRTINQLNSVISFVEQLENMSEEEPKIQRPQTDEERMALSVQELKQCLLTILLQQKQKS
jgi:hypothetical protein